MTNIINAYKYFFALLVLLSCINCKSVDEQVSEIAQSGKHKDPHTYSNFNSIVLNHLDLDLSIDFEHKILMGSATWTTDKLDKKDDKIILDTYKLNIDSILLDNGKKALYHLDKHDDILGSALTIKIEHNTNKFTVYYRTHPTATALQWLSAQQTFDKKHPFLYTQGESIYTRSWIPCQDAPAVRFTYNATIKTPRELMAVMSASNMQEKNKDGVYHFEMKQKIPAYLVALAVGDLQFKPLTDKMGVYAEPSQIHKCVAELADLNTMMHAAEQLYGPYAWDRYDVLFLPSGFPFGGMENPRLTFATPTILTGDKSLVNLIAHELAHSWSGNLVTNATWNDFWLNESFTVYFERRIMEAVEGKEFAAMLWDIGLQDLNNSLKKYKDNNQLPLTKLKLDLTNQDPDLGLTDFAYEKGAAMLLLIEQTIGRPALDTFIQQYFEQKKFTSVFTDDFDKFISKNLFNKYPDLRTQIKFDEWIYEEGLPSVSPVIDNIRFKEVENFANDLWINNNIDAQATKLWSTFEWLHFIRYIQQKIKDKSFLATLDQKFNLSNTTNAEIATQWYVLAIKMEYDNVLEPMKLFLKETGRMKFLEPIYEALYTQNSNYQKLSKELFQQYKMNYHPLAQKSVAQILNVSL